MSVVLPELLELPELPDPPLTQLSKVATDLLKKRKQFEFDQWQKWKNGGQKVGDLRPLLQSMRPLIQKQVNVYKNRVPIPPAAIEAEFTRHAMTAFKTYDPKRKAQLGTHVQNQMMKGRRFINTYQNLGYIPEHRVNRIGEYKVAMSSLQENLGRPPNTTELSEHLSWSPAEVGRMQKEDRSDLAASGFVTAEGETYDPASLMPSREREVMKLIQYELSPDEKAVYEYTYGMNGKSQMQPGQIASKMNFSKSKVSRIRNAIAGKIKGYLK